MDPIAQCVLGSHAALLRAARNKLRNAHWAEDAVSETVLAALEKPPAFHEPGRVQAWLFGVLHYKVVDQVRTHTRGAMDFPGEDPADPDAPEVEISDSIHDPERKARNAQFVARLAEELARLPTPHAQAFLMREAWGHDPQDISKSLGITVNNLWVILHRTRQKLRLALAMHGP
jgi:RNA polymerase sigma-70 factor (ECF subfamily)